jgi:hypothetical protein
MLFVFVDLGICINWDRDYMVFVDRNRALLATLHLHFHNTLATTASPLLAIILTRNPESRSKKHGLLINI